MSTRNHLFDLSGRVRNLFAVSITQYTMATCPRPRIQKYRRGEIDANRKHFKSLQRGDIDRETYLTMTMELLKQKRTQPWHPNCTLDSIFSKLVCMCLIGYTKSRWETETMVEISGKLISLHQHVRDVIASIVKSNRLSSEVQVDLARNHLAPFLQALNVDIASISARQYQCSRV